MKNMALPKKANRKPRLILVLSVIFIFYAALIGRLYFIMVVKGREYKALAINQWTDTLTLAPKRGRILDRNGQVLALTNNLYRIDADLSILKDTISLKKKTIDAVSKDIAKILNMSVDDVTKDLNSTDKNGNPLKFISLKRAVEKSSADEIKALKLNGLIISEDTKRYYPNGSFLQQVLGRTDINGDGISGVELSYNKELMGIPGIKVLERDSHNNDLPYTNEKDTQPVNGKDIVLTIDERIQELAETVAENALKQNNAKSVSITVMNPQNGEILAMANKNDFDLNNSGSGNSNDTRILEKWKNNAVENVFEPGSIFKVIVSAAALEYNAVSPSDRFVDNGSIKVGDKTLYSDEKSGFGIQTFSDIIKNSSNVGFIQLAQKIGKDNLYNYSQLMGFGNKTGIDLPGESGGIIKELKNIGPVDLATMSYGHGLAVTQIQYMAAFNAVANGGVWIKPHIMKEVVHTEDNKQIVDKEYNNFDKKDVMSKDKAAELRSYLERVVKEGTATATYIEGYNIAGKTGTAEKVNIKNGGYENNKYVSSFAGMAPASNPKFTLIVTIDEPDSSKYYAAETAVPAAKELFTGIFNYLK